MTKLVIHPVKTTTDVESVVNLGNEIWKEHYSPIIGKDQVEYMLEKFQSTEAINNQLEEGYLYFLLMLNNDEIGYLSIQPRENLLFLSKVYLLKSFRGRGFFTSVLLFIENLAADLKVDKIQLTVNKHNSKTISAYQAKGFTNIKSAVFDIGNGFVMDDYIMEKAI